jgi:glucosyl-3-phosphoglycerate synthase
VIAATGPPPAGVSALAQAKAALGTRVSVCIPARDEEATLGAIVATIVRDLMGRYPLVDEVVVLDDASVDATADIAAGTGARVVTVEHVLPWLPAGSGKGNALWKFRAALRDPSPGAAPATVGSGHGQGLLPPAARR